MLAFVLTAAIPFTSQPADAAAAPAIWVGSPVNGTWGVPGIGSTTPAGNHHRLAKASPQNDWAVDLSGAGAGPAAILYVARSNAAYSSRVIARVGQIIDNSACANGGGGDLVTIRILFDGVTVGQVTYAHLNRNPALVVGQNVNRWGAQLGTVANLTGGATGGANCWTGPHVHTELRATSNFACWNRGFRTSQGLSRSTFIGFVIGPTLADTARPCP